MSDCDEAEVRLPVEELLLIAEAGVTVSGIEVKTYCFNGLPVNEELLREQSTDCSSEGVSAEPCVVVDMFSVNGTQWRELAFAQ